MASAQARPMWEPAILREAVAVAVRKLKPSVMVRNPVMFLVALGSAYTTLLGVHAAITGVGDARPGFAFAISAWLWATVFFANFAEALAEGRGRAQAASLRKARQDVMGRVLPADTKWASDPLPVWAETRAELRPSSQLRRGDLVLVLTGDLVPADGVVVAGVASVDESAITGESAPVIRESGGDRDAVTGGTRVVSDWLVVRVTADPGSAFLDRMIAMVEGARRQKTPNEIALDILVAGMSILLLVATVTLWPFSSYAAAATGHGQPVPLTVLVALLVCLIPTTIGGLLSAIGIAGMDRLVQANVIATSGRAVEAAGDVDVLLLDKTGTITWGNRMATALLPADGVAFSDLAQTASAASLADETAEGRSVVVLCRDRYGIPDRPSAALDRGGVLVPFAAQTRMSGMDVGGQALRKGAGDAVRRHVAALGGAWPGGMDGLVADVARRGATPLVVARDATVLGVIVLEDVVKPGIRERFGDLRRMGIRTVMITGDNPLTAAAIAAEAGVDDFLAEATPEAKLAMIRDYQRQGRMVAMTGDGTNDAPALAQADVAVAMNSGTQAAKEAGNMVDLDSDPTKLLRIVEIGKQLLMTRGALTTFSIANDLAKYFAILPAAFVTTTPELQALDVMGLSSPENAVLAAVIFNALVLVALIPLALRGVAYHPMPAARLLRRNLLVYGLGGLVAPFPCIWALDRLLAWSVS